MLSRGTGDPDGACSNETNPNLILTCAFNRIRVSAVCNMKFGKLLAKVVKLSAAFCQEAFWLDYKTLKKMLHGCERVGALPQAPLGGLRKLLASAPPAFYKSLTVQRATRPRPRSLPSSRLNSQKLPRFT